MKKYIILLLSSLLLLSCSEYQKLLKSNDAELKYSKAIEYFEKGQYMKANTLFDEVTHAFKGTNRSGELLNYIAKSYIGQKDYNSACEYFKLYARTYPKGVHAAESKFMIGYCYYKESPDPKLNQGETEKAIEALQEFIDIFPEDARVPEANVLIDELRDKLAYKELLNAKLYYNLGNYLGWNNYLSATIVAKNTLKKYPSTKLREDLNFIVLESKYQQAVQSVPEKMQERYSDAYDEYHNFITEHPNGKFRKKADRIFKEIEKKTKH